ncbi:transcriptional regulator, TetR family [Paenibacillus curdlanolyticus YK9]|uniref:Transcriptional regulator, TetR family n=1 Tax=Paenibacillus curdlanolyticus YK9 TaxID=717606 RepID=E0I9I6_9BACL|nr:TetR/AcrR family transcriptional regulator [Paenibacillus curdlanolyticus]EFM11070.1 transcriptional regulator, TetR family [Paenibacillus curdlanolyticus YK9]
MNKRSLRDIKKEATANAIADAAYELVLERGFDGFVVEDIVHRAGFSRRTFANHFSCKEEAVVMAVLSFKGKQEAVDLLAGMPVNTPPLDILYHLMKMRLTTELLWKMNKLVLLSEQNPTLKPYMLSVIRRLQNECQELVTSLSTGRYPAAYTHILSGAVFGAIMPILDGSLQVRFPDQTDAELPEAMTFEHYLDATFNYLRKGF